MLDQIIPFRYLSRQLRDRLRQQMTEHSFAAGEVIVEQRDSDDARVFLLLEGRAEAYDKGKPVGAISAGTYFGERAALFDESRKVELRASEDVRALSMTGEHFLELLDASRPFAQGLSQILRHKQGIFVAFEQFMSELLRGVGQGHVDLHQLLPLYKALRPALHQHANSEELDISALSYAVRRLPENLTRTFAYYVTQTLALHYGDPNKLFKLVPTAGRRHTIYQVMPGKNMVLTRDGASDMIDMFSCLCLYIIEARKIRRRLQDADVLLALTRDNCNGLPFSPEEMAGLEKIWPEDIEQRLREIVVHHEDIRIEVHRMLNNYNRDHAEEWSAQLAEATRELMGCDPADLPGNIPVHIISSNTHSVPNCLSPWLDEHGEEILAWARETEHELVDQPWADSRDATYAIARDYFAEHPSRAAEKAAADREAGIVRLRETAFTGIEVQLIDLQRQKGVPGLLVNIDYAFGQQAEHILGNLLALFACNVASVNVLGKAGGLLGQRGDILAATAFVEQESDLFQPVNGAIDYDRLEKLAHDRDVHIGPVLTVAGTLLQNRQMLQLNKHIWGCIGLEMEGTYYFRQVLESMNRGVVSRDIEVRFLYYISDLPLDHEANLSGRLRAIEGVPPLYAVTREILAGILAST